MAYMNQEKKAKISVALKPILKKYGIKGTLSVRSHMCIVLTLKSGKIDFVENLIQTNKFKINDAQIANLRNNRVFDVNPHWFQEQYTGVAKNFLTEAFAALKSAGWYDRSDAMTDYFDTAYYVDLSVGKWKQPYEVVA
jgi:hypothetical protein